MFITGMTAIVGKGTGNARAFQRRAVPGRDLDGEPGRLHQCGPCQGRHPARLQLQRPALCRCSPHRRHDVLSRDCAAEAGGAGGGAVPVAGGRVASRVAVAADQYVLASAIQLG